jgi:hypothetical protein
MLRRRQINADPSGAAKRLLLGALDAVRRPFEAIVWPLERRLLWPLRERAAGWSPPRQLAGGAALGLVAIAAVLVGVLLSSGGGSGPERIAAPARVSTPAPAAKPASGKSDEPTLQGVPPSFGAGEGTGVAKQSADGTGAGAPEAGAEASGSGAEAEATTGSPAGEGEAAATSSTAKPVAAGPEAMKVARRFSEAFVFYEIGKRPARAKTVFGETATPQLAEALAERPPRLPRGTKVPKAKVVNLVPGPRRGRAYTVSVALLRVGVTSELRLSLQHTKADGWQVTSVLG